MNIKLLKSFGVMGFSFQIDKEGNVSGSDKEGHQLEEGVDYILEKKDEKFPISIEQSNGLTIYVPR